MKVSSAQVRKVAKLARIKVTDEEVAHLEDELTAILKWVEQLEEVSTDGIEPMTGVANMAMKKRKDEVTDGGYADVIVQNAPLQEDHFFMVPRVVE